MHLHTDVDLYYIANYSFWLDLRILWKTLWVVLQGRGTCWKSGCEALYSCKDVVA